MKRFLILLSVIFPTLVFGQAISYRALNPNQFSTPNFTVSILGTGVTNIPITGLQGSGGAGTAATNGTAGWSLFSAGNGGVYWGLNPDSLLATYWQTNTTAADSIQTSNHVTFDGGMTINGGLTADSFSIATNLYGSVTAVNFQNQISTTNLAGDITFDLGLVNFNPTNENSLILKCFGDGANRTITPPASWWTDRADHVVTNGQWSWIMISAQIGVVTNMAQKDFPN